MQTDRWKKIEEIFCRAVTLPSAERRKFVETECAGDDELYGEILTLITADGAEENFLDEQVFTLGAQVLEMDELLGRESEFAFYRIEKLLGRGGMGAVYLAEDKRLERPVALKILPRSLGADAEGVRRFRQEARTASSISHPNIAHIYEFGEEAGRYFLAMEYVAGKTLRELLGEKTLDVRRSLEIMLQIAEALAATHQRGIIHRDIKPENIIVTGGGLVKVLDFGVAKMLDFYSPERVSVAPPTSLVNTTPGMVMGTIGYISPEQLQNKQADFRADIWSAGVVLYEMLAGRKPFEGKSAKAVGKAILTRKPVPISISLLSPQDNALLNGIITKTLSKNPAKRYGSAAELAGELKELLNGPEFNRQPFFSENLSENLLSNTGKAAESSVFLTFLTRTKQFWNLQSFPIKMILSVAAIALLTFGIGIFARYLGQNMENSQNAANFPKITRLTQDGRIQDAAISGDGQLLAYVPIEAGRQSLWIRDMGKASDRRLVPPDFVRYWGMRFTPDRQSLVFIATSPSGTESVLYRIELQDDGTPQKIVSNIAEPPAISPDGQKIAFVRSDPAHKRDVLLTAKIDGTVEKELAARQFPDTFSPASAAWSADGKLIALGAGRNKNAENALVAVPVDGGEVIELTPWKWAAVGGVAWESGGDGMVFSAREFGSKVLRLWRLSLPGGLIRSLTDEETALEEVTLAQNENTLVTIRTYEVSDIWSVDRSDTLHRLTTIGNNGADGLAFLPPEQIVYTEGEYEQSFLWTMKTDGSDRKPLTKNTGFLPAVSRDGRFITYVSVQDGIRHIRLMDADGQNDRQLTAGDGENYPTFTPDGNWIVYTSLGKEHNTLWKIPTGGGQPVQLTREGFTIKPHVSPDGTMIACTYRRVETDEWKIVVLPVAGGAPVKTFDLPTPRAQMIRWTPDSRGLLYTDRKNGAQNLWRQMLDAAPPAQVTNFTEDQILHHDLGAGGTKFILSRGGRRRDIALIKNYK